MSNLRMLRWGSRPDCFAHLDENYKFSRIENLKEDRVVGWLAMAQCRPDTVEIHFEIESNMPSDFKVMKEALAVIVDRCKLHNIKNIATVNPNPEDEKWAKFMKFLGFEPPVLVQASVLRL